MEVKQEVDVGVIKSFITFIFLSIGLLGYAQNDSISVYKKKVLESTEVDFLMGYYEQEGVHASVTGGIGNEDLHSTAPTLVIRIPLNDDDVLTVDAGLSAYTSASSSNGNPFNQTGASSGEEDYDDEDDKSGRRSGEGSPWVPLQEHQGKMY